MNLLVNADVLQALGPVMEALKEFNISGPNGLLAVYYLACNNDLQRYLLQRKPIYNIYKMKPIYNIYILSSIITSISKQP